MATKQGFMKKSRYLALPAVLASSFLVGCAPESEACKLARQQFGEAELQLVAQKENAKRMADYPPIFVNAAQMKVGSAKKIQKAACK
jgi:hypothetical protein